jgi:hypothetical protein
MTTITFDNCPMALNICRAINDTFPFRFNIKYEDESAVDITGFAFSLTVDPSDEPPDGTGKLFTLTGTIIDGPNGIVEFGLSAVEAEQTPDTYYFDIQMTDAASKIRTIAKGEWVFSPDITK